jgi:predicted RNA-binding Zn-ribbon protein involved in translation (DUF1610 family)
MPEGAQPCFGETWVHPKGNVHGIVAKTDATMTTFVSLTGVRVPLHTTNVHHVWNFVNDLPTYHIGCSRKGCERPAFIQYERPLQKDVEVVCPLHVPRGIRSKIKEDQPNSIVLTATFEGQKCYKCGEDATEIMGELPIEDKSSMWQCQTCGQWWIYREFTDRELQDKLFSPSVSVIRKVAEEIKLPGFITLQTDAWQDHLRRSLIYVVFVKPKALTQLKGLQPLTIYDYVKLDDQF